MSLIYNNFRHIRPFLYPSSRISKLISILLGIRYPAKYIFSHLRILIQTLDIQKSIFREGQISGAGLDTGRKPDIENYIRPSNCPAGYPDIRQNNWSAGYPDILLLYLESMRLLGVHFSVSSLFPS